MFETGVVGAYECYSVRKVRRHNRDIVLIFLNKIEAILMSIHNIPLSI